MKNTQYYSQAEHSVVLSAVDGSFSIPLSDFAEGDDVIAIEPLSDRVALTQGLDKSILSFSSTDGGTGTVRLKPTSPQAGFIYQLFNRQRTTPVLVNLTVSTGVREVVRLEECGVQVESFNTGGPTAQPRGFIFTGAKLNYDESQGA